MSIADVCLLAGRTILAAVFLLSGSTKLVDPVGLRKALRDFGLPSMFAPATILLLPLLELAVAAALVVVSLSWYGAWGALILLTVFLLAVVVAMARGRKPDCHCFGQLHSSPVGSQTLVRNVVLAACAGGLAWSGDRNQGPDIWPWLASLDGVPLRIAIGVGCIAGLVFIGLLYSARPRKAPVEAPELPEIAEVEEPAPPPTHPPAPRPGQPEPEPPETQPKETPPVKPGPMGIGLPIGAAAPEFELPNASGDTRSLEALKERGRDLMLVFSSPFCHSCEALAGSLVRWMREMEGLPKIVIVSRGKPEDNLAKMKGFEPSRVLLQKDSEVSEAYDVIATPSAVLIGTDGRIKSELTTGGDAIGKLLASCRTAEARKRRDRQAPLP